MPTNIIRSYSDAIASMNVPVQNSPANLLERDVLGNKTDTIAGNSVYSKLIVPAQNSAINVDARDVIGQKTDTIAGNSIYSKLIVPAQNSVVNVDTRDVIGNKTDTVAGNSIYSVINRVEDHIHGTGYLAPRNVGAGVPLNAIPLQTAAGAWAWGNWTEIWAGVNFTAPFDIHQLYIFSISANDMFVLQLGTGAGGAEMVVTEIAFTRSAVASNELPIYCMSPIFPAGTRIAARIASAGGGAKTCGCKILYHYY